MGDLKRAQNMLQRMTFWRAQCINLEIKRGSMGTIFGVSRPEHCDGVAELTPEKYGGLTKSQACKEFVRAGWTYNDNGRWLCPVCSEGGEE
mgnify:CR=1 FL=1